MEKQNQHYVPQYYFRNFSNNKESIRMILKSDGKIIENITISNQTSRNNFYGDTEIESKVTEYDTKYSKILLDIIEEITIGQVTDKNIIEIIKAICFQKLRTLTYRNLQTPLMEFNEDFFEPQINNLDNLDSGISKEANEAINKVMKNIFNDLSDGKKCQIYEMFNIKNEFDEISDLNIIFIENKTNIPFIFSDDPIVRLNIALQDYDCSKTGNTNYGLIIYYPITSENAVLMFDSEAYDLLLNLNRNIISLENQNDIDTLNKLQIYNADNSIYFKDYKYKDYIYNLWNSEKNNYKSQNARIVHLEEITLDGYKTGKKVSSLIRDEIEYSSKLTFLNVKNVYNNQSFKFYRSKFITFNPEYSELNAEKIHMKFDKKPNKTQEKNKLP